MRSLGLASHPSIVPLFFPEASWLVIRCLCLLAHDLYPYLGYKQVTQVELVSTV